MTEPELKLDKTLKAILNPDCIRQMLRDYVCDEATANALNFDDIERINSEFVDPGARRYFQSDMVWKIGYKDQSRQPLYLALLLELQSRPCYHMALRMLNYIIQFYLCLAENNPMAKAFPLPEVIPVVLYTGRRKWNGPLNISELIATRSGADPKRQAPINFEYILLNAPLTTLKGAENSILWHLIECFKIDDRIKLAQKWRQLKTVLPDLNTDINAWCQLIAMLAEQLKEGNMSTKITTDAEYTEVTMDDVDHLFDEEGSIIVGEKRMLLLGEAKGRAEGRAEGKSEERINNLKQVLFGKFGDITEEQLAAVLEYRDEPDLFARIIKADSLDELLQLLR